MSTSNHEPSAPANTTSGSARTSIFEHQPAIVRIVRSIWRVNPFIVLGICILLGTLPLIYAAFVSPIGTVSYYLPVGTDATVGEVVCTKALVTVGTCIEKQVGYAYAINWWPVLVIFMPFALFFAFTSVQSMQRVFSRMLDQGMFCNHDWSFSMEDRPGSTLAGLKALVRQLWVTFSVAGFFILLVVTATVAIDWYCVVNAPLIFGDLLTHIAADERPALCRNVAGQEVDWSIAAIFGGSSSIQLPEGEAAIPGWNSNYVFSAFVYGLLLVEINLLFIYFSFIFALALSVHRLRRGQFGIRILPNLKSSDALKRMGFENFEPVLQPCIFVTILSFIMAFTMRIQNEYLRDEYSDNIFGFMFGGIADSVSSNGSLKGIGQMFDIGRLADPNSQISGPVMIITFALVSIALAFILRHAAREAANSVGQALQQDGVQERVVALYAIDREILEQRLEEIVVWPLSWPRLRQMFFLAAAGIACFFFYKLAFIWIAIVLVRMVRTEFSGQADNSGRG